MPEAIICFDLDGTLLDKNEMIHPADIEILKTKHDVVFMPCTGRPLVSVVSMFHHNGLFENENIPFPMVTQNGSATHLPDRGIYKYHYFEKQVQDRLVEIFNDIPQTSFMWMTRHETFLQWPNDFSTHWMKRFFLEWERFDGGTPSSIEFGKATCLTNDPVLIAELTGVLKNEPVEIGLSLSSVFDINPGGITKRTGVEELVQYLKLPEAPIYVAGDGENDLDLFTLGTVSFAPATSPEHIRKQAGRTIDRSKNGILTSMLEEAGVLV